MQQNMEFNFGSPAPLLIPHAWPFPGLTPFESAQSALAMSSEFADVIAATFFAQGGAPLTQEQLKHLLPPDWVERLGKFAHASLSCSQAERRGIDCQYVPHDGGGFHFQYRILS